jgi:hypothetical protein
MGWAADIVPHLAYGMAAAKTLDALDLATRASLRRGAAT